MALKDYVVFQNNDKATETSTVVDLTGQKILDVVNYGASDFGNRYYQPSSGAPFYTIAWDGSHTRTGIDGQVLSSTRVLFGDYTTSYVDQIAFDTNGDAYWYGPDNENAGRLTVWKALATETEIGRPTVVDYVGSGDVLFDAVQVIDGKTACIFSFGGGPRFFIMTEDGVTRKLLSKALSGGTWTDHGIPADIANLSNAVHFTLIDTNVVASINDTGVAAGSPTFFVAPFSTLTFDGGTALPGAVTTSTVNAHITEWSGFALLDTSLYGRYNIDGAEGLIQFNAATKVITLTPVGTAPIDVTLSGIRYTIDNPLNNITKDTSPLTDGRWAMHANRWDAHTGTYVSSDSLVIVNAAVTTIISPLYTAVRESGVGQGSQDFYGVVTLRFNTHEITGNVTIGGTPTANVKVGILNSSGKVNTSTLTDVNGDYTLTCLDGNPKQVVAYAANGTSEVHGQVTPTEVL